MSASPVIPGIIAALSVFDGFVQQCRACVPINAPEPDRTIVNASQHVHVGQRMPALVDAEPEPDSEVGDDGFESSSAGPMADQCPAWQHGTPVHELPLARKLLVEVAYSDDSVAHAVWTYFAALHGAIGCFGCRRRREEESRRVGRRVHSARASPAW